MAVPPSTLDMRASKALLGENTSNMAWLIGKLRRH